MERLKQTVECLRMRSSGRGPELHGPDEAVAVVGKRGYHDAGNRGIDAGEVGHQDLDCDVSGTVAGGKNQEHECGNA